MIESIYKVRRFFVQDHVGTSGIYGQSTGIAQGCPLSPFLFVIVQSVMFSDIYSKYEFDEEPAFVVTREVLYADDTLLVSTSSQNLQRLLDAVVREGARYGLELNWDKTFQMAVGSTGSIERPGGGDIEKKTNVIYLGGLISRNRKTLRVPQRFGRE